MNSNLSLADEKQALLAKMEASRIAYQRMLLGTDQQHAAVEHAISGSTFPKSQTGQWISAHPYLTLLGIVAVAMATRPAPRQAARTVWHKGQRVSSLLSSNQNQLRMAFGIATALGQYIARHRAHQ